MNKLQRDNDIIISKTVFLKMISQIIIENKDLFVGKNYLKQKNDKKAVNILINEGGKSIKVLLNLNATYAKNINELASKLQSAIKSEIEQMTEYQVEAVDINIVRVSK